MPLYEYDCQSCDGIYEAVRLRAVRLAWQEPQAFSTFSSI